MQVVPPLVSESRNSSEEGILTCSKGMDDLNASQGINFERELLILVPRFNKNPVEISVLGGAE